MNLPNRIPFHQLREMSKDQIAELSVEELALLAEDVADLKALANAVDDKLRSGLDLKYGSQAAALRRNEGKDTGTARVTDGCYVVVADLPKRVKWDQKKLAVAIKTIVDEWRDDPAQYVTTEYKISETAYGAWPTVVRKLFEPARTVETGKPTFRIEPLQKETY